MRNTLDDVSFNDSFLKRNRVKNKQLFMSKGCKVIHCCLRREGEKIASTNQSFVT